eukprot:145216-Rhodomonas_salina.2
MPALGPYQAETFQMTLAVTTNSCKLFILLNTTGTCTGKGPGRSKALGPLAFNDSRRNSPPSDDEGAVSSSSRTSRRLVLRMGPDISPFSRFAAVRHSRGMHPPAGA